MQQPGSGALFTRNRGLVSHAYRAKQDGVSLAREFKRGFGQRHAVRLYASLADGSLLRFGLRRHDPQHLESLRDYFGADTIAGHDCNLHL